MQKIVINKDYGGCSLSPKAVELLAAKKGHDKIYWFTVDYKNQGRESEMIPCEDPTNAIFTMAYTTPDAQENTSLSSHPGNDERDDPDLVAVVEELGEAANSRYARLRIVEVPDDVEWQIEEYDGLEWIAEKHRTWG